MIIGVDPGKTGAFAALDGDSLLVADMPLAGQGRASRVVGSAIAELLRGWSCLADVEFVVLEHINTHQMASPSSSFRYGQVFGTIEGVIGALGMRIEYVTPARWKAATRTPTAKDGARLRASQLFPQYTGLWRRVKDHDRAEAALVAFYGREFI